MFDTKKKNILLSTNKLDDGKNENTRCLSNIYVKDVLNDVSIRDGDDNDDDCNNNGNGENHENIFYEICDCHQHNDGDKLNKENFLCCANSNSFRCATTINRIADEFQNHRNDDDADDGDCDINNSVYQPIPMTMNTVSIQNSLNLRTDKKSSLQIQPHHCNNSLSQPPLAALRNLFLFYRACACKNTTTHSKKSNIVCCTTTVAKNRKTTTTTTTTTNSLESIDGNNDGDDDSDSTFDNIKIQDENNETITTIEDTAKIVILLKCLIFSHQSPQTSDTSDVNKVLLKNKIDLCINNCNNINNNNNNNKTKTSSCEKSCENFDKCIVEPETLCLIPNNSNSNNFEASSRLKRLENNYREFCLATKSLHENNFNGKKLFIVHANDGVGDDDDYDGDGKTFVRKHQNENIHVGVNFHNHKGVNNRGGELVNNNNSLLLEFTSSFARSNNNNNKLPSSSSCFYFRNDFNDLFFHHLNSFSIDSNSNRRHTNYDDKSICGTRLKNSLANNNCNLINNNNKKNLLLNNNNNNSDQEEDDNAELSTNDLSSDSEEVSKVFSGVNIDTNENEFCDTNPLRNYVLSQKFSPNCEFDAKNFQNYSNTNAKQINFHNYELISCYDELIEDDDIELCTNNNFYSNDDDNDNPESNFLNFRRQNTGTNWFSEKLNNKNNHRDTNKILNNIELNKNIISDKNNSTFNINYNNNSNSHCSNNKIENLKMRESAGQLRGLLKKPNRPPTHRKNRVVFDETKNEFFDADYIILIREDCPYDEEDEEPCTCGEHELVRLCCDEGCQCPNYTSATQITQTAAATAAVAGTQSQQPLPNVATTVIQNEDGRTPQSPKFAPPIEFVDQATLSPPEGYKDNGSLTNALGGALGGHVFGAQHIQQLQVIQRLQQQRAAMLAARNTSQQQISTVGLQQAQQVGQQQQQAIIQSQNFQNQMISQTVCTECAECAECAVKQQMVDEDIESPCSEDIATLEVPHVALVPLQAASPERRITQKEIIAGEERPKYMTLREPPPGGIAAATTTVVSGITEQLQLKIVQQSYEVNQPIYESAKSTTTTTTTIVNMPIPQANIAGHITGILKGGKLWKSETTQCDDSTNVTSDEEGGSKRSVRFNENVNEQLSNDSIDQDVSEELAPPQVQPISEDELANAQRPPLPVKKHTSSIFHNALRPNSAVRQLFPATGPVNKPIPPTGQQNNNNPVVSSDPNYPTVPLLTHETLRAFEEAKRNTLSKTVQIDSETDTIKRTIERNALRRSLIKYEPKKKPQRVDTSLEERIRKLTCDIDEPINNDDSVMIDDCDLLSDQQRADISNSSNQEMNETERRNSPAGEEIPNQGVQKYFPDKTYSPSSSASSSSSGSTSAYRKITEIFNRERRQERIPEADENSIVIIPQPDCRCPAAPDLGMGIQMPPAHTQIHQTPPRQNESKRQFLSTLVPLTSCVAGQRDDFSYYTLAPGERGSTASSQLSEYSLADIDSVLHDDVEIRKVAPDVIAGTPGQESDELTNFAQQEASRTEKLKKKYSGENIAHQPNSGDGSDDDDEQNDYGFNRRPSVRGIKPRFGSTNEILQQMQNQLSQTGPMDNQQGSQSHVQNNPPVSASQSKQMPNQQINNNGQVPTGKQQITAAHHQHTTAWAYYPEMQSRVPIDHTNANYYHINPAAAAAAAAHQNRHLSYHHDHHEEATIYQNCHTVSVEQHHYGHFARSPTRRPESPPPLRNYHQTMVLIPYSTEPYAHYATNDQVAQQFQRHNVLEYQQVTQQTIRVPMGYPLPGMQLHVVAGRGNAATTTNANYSQTYSRISGRNYQNQYATADLVKFGERGAPEGAASIMPSDCNVMSPTTAQPNNNLLNQANSTQNPTSNIQNQHSSAVFYAMNV